MAQAQIVLTNHARERMMLRRISEDMIRRTILQADGREREGDGDTQFNKRINGRAIHVVAKPMDNSGWLVKTTWVDGEDDPNPLVKTVITLLAKLLQVFFKRR